MPVPTLISQLSTTASLNSPDGAVDVPSSIDDYLRAHAAFIAQLHASTATASQSLAANGYQKLPSGLIVQWTSVVLYGVTANVFQTITLPISFPNTIFRAFASNISTSQTDTFATNCIEYDLSSVKVSWSATNQGNVGARIIAIGY